MPTSANLITHLDRDTTDIGPWLAIATICGCGHVAITLMDNWTPGTENAEGDHEATATGTDWKTLAETTARQLHQRTGARISGMCTVIHVQDKQQWASLSDEATRFMYALGDAVDQQTALF